MRDNPFAEVEQPRSGPPGSVPGTGLGRQIGSIEANPGPAGRGWWLAYVDADRHFATLAGMLVLVGLAVWLMTSILS